MMKNWQRNLAIAAGVGVGVVVISRQATAGLRNVATETGRLVDQNLNPARETNLANRAVVGTLKFFGALPEDATTVAPLIPGFTRPPEAGIKSTTIAEQLGLGADQGQQTDPDPAVGWGFW